MALDHTPIFPVADVASFVALQRATRPDPATGKPDPAVMKPFLAAHPEVKAFQDYMAKAVLPDSFANATYYSINAFRFTNAAGRTDTDGVSTFKQVTFSISWRDYNNRSHTRSYETFLGRYGLSDYFAATHNPNTP